MEQRSGEISRLEPQDLSVTVELGLCHCSKSVTVELGLCHCSKLPDKVDNQTD